MAIYVYPADAQGCGHYRLIWPGLALASQGHDVRVISPDSRDGIAGDIDRRTKSLVDLRVPDDADAVVIQRPTMRYLAEGVRLFHEQRRHVAIVVDMDDDLDHVDSANPAFWALHKDYGYEQHTAGNAWLGCRYATLVTVSTPALLRTYAPHGRGLVLPNRVPAGFLDIPHDDSPVMSWPGSIHSHPWDLHQVGAAVTRLVRLGHRYAATGASFGIRDALRLDADPDLLADPAWRDDSVNPGDVRHERWPWAVAQIGVGMAPLADTRFNAAKSWLKPLEMSAVGVPWVASPRVEYRRLHDQHRVGLLAKDPGQWYQHLRRLVNDEALRVEQSQAGRACGAANTVEEHAWRWMEAWTSAISMARTRHPVLGAAP